MRIVGKIRPQELCGSIAYGHTKQADIDPAHTPKEQVETRSDAKTACEADFDDAASRLAKNVEKE